jgi:hypothetical protein
MGKPFNLYDFDDAANLVGSKLTLPKSGTRDFPLASWWSRLFGRADTTLSHNERRPDPAVRATRFYFGDHWQDEWGFIGQLPPRSLPGSASMTEEIQKGFIGDNVIREVVKTHVGGILGREPSWSFLETFGEENTEPRSPFSKETGETLTRWWNDRKALKDLQDATRILVCEGRVVRRLFFPRGRLRDGAIDAARLIDALDFIYFETVYADQGGVFTDPETMLDIGIFLFDEVNANNEVVTHCADLSFLDENGDTICKTVKDRGAPITYGPYPLGGRLLIYEMTREQLITEQMQSNQRALNLAHTQMIRNVNLAGNRQQTITNAQPPVPKTDKPTITKDTVKTADGRFPGTFKVGVGAVNFLMGVPIRDEDGNIKGYTNPNVSISDPVSVETFKETIAQEKEAIYAQAHQRHVLIVDKADTSGRAREVARREYERSLKESKTELDACGRWQLETTLRLAAFVINESSRYLNLRADFNTLIDAGDPDPEKQKTALLLRQPGGLKNQPLISDETARNWAGVEDAAAELARIEQESKLPEAELPENLLPTEGQQTPKPASASVN